MVIIDKLVVVVKSFWVQCSEKVCSKSCRYNYYGKIKKKHFTLHNYHLEYQILSAKTKKVQQNSNRLLLLCYTWSVGIRSYYI